jgi:hypothetical protein
MWLETKTFTSIRSASAELKVRGSHHQYGRLRAVVMATLDSEVADTKT